MKRTDVAALYVDPRGPYPKLVEHWWDEKRDARTYNLTLPLVCHPPCGPWGALAHLYKGHEHDCAPRALEQVRAFGGILEHPAQSALWAAFRLPKPDELWDEHDGFSVAVDQVSWGHVARKKTWLYCVGVSRALVFATLRTGGTPTHWVSGFRSTTRRNRYAQNGSAVPDGIKVCSAQQRRRTPLAFAEWLLELAATARPQQAADLVQQGIGTRRASR